MGFIDQLITEGHHPVGKFLAKVAQPDNGTVQWGKKASICFDDLKISPFSIGRLPQCQTKPFALLVGMR
jgi:hypothetical protein